jgi:hypothetical protein
MSPPPARTWSVQLHSKFSAQGSVTIDVGSSPRWITNCRIRNSRSATRIIGGCFEWCRDKDQASVSDPESSCEIRNGRNVTVAGFLFGLIWFHPANHCTITARARCSIILTRRMIVIFLVLGFGRHCQRDTYRDCGRSGRASSSAVGELDHWNCGILESRSTRREGARPRLCAWTWHVGHSGTVKCLPVP